MNVISYKIKERRNGDLASTYADVSLAKELLGWIATKNIDDMCNDTWQWQFKNPKGYE